MAVIPREGEILTSRLNGKKFTVTLAGERMVVLEAEDKSVRFVTTVDKLGSYYKQLDSYCPSNSFQGKVVSESGGVRRSRNG